MTKWIVVLAALTCNQVVYDQIYETLIQQTIRTEDYKQKIDTVQLLKELCNDQPFSFELGNTGARTKNGLPVQE